jgi:hypothetical protein
MPCVVQKKQGFTVGKKGDVCQVKSEHGKQMIEGGKQRKNHSNITH